MQIFQILIDIEPFIIGCFVHHLGRKRRTILSLERIKWHKQDLLFLKFAHGISTNKVVGPHNVHCLTRLVLVAYQDAVQASKKAESDKESGSLTRSSQQVLTPIPGKRQSGDRNYFDLQQLMEEVVGSWDANRTNIVVGRFVQHSIVSQWRKQVGRTVMMNFNCYCMLPL